jgi:hypothetical protein
MRRLKGVSRHLHVLFKYSKVYRTHTSTVLTLFYSTKIRVDEFLFALTRAAARTLSLHGQLHVLSALHVQLYTLVPFNIQNSCVWRSQGPLHAHEFFSTCRDDMHVLMNFTHSPKQMRAHTQKITRSLL